MKLLKNLNFFSIREPLNVDSFYIFAKCNLICTKICHTKKIIKKNFTLFYCKFKIPFCWASGIEDVLEVLWATVCALDTCVPTDLLNLAGTLRFFQFFLNFTQAPFSSLCQRRFLILQNFIFVTPLYIVPMWKNYFFSFIL